MTNNTTKTIKILLDSGSSDTLINHNLVSNFRKQTSQPAKWKTAVGTLNTTKIVKTLFTLPEFYEQKVIQTKAYVFTTKIRYDMIIGRDLLHKLGIVLDFDHNTIHWKEAIVPMKNPEAEQQEAYIQDST